MSHRKIFFALLSTVVLGGLLVSQSTNAMLVSRSSLDSDTDSGIVNPTDTTFSVGDAVSSTVVLNVRASASSRAAIISTIPADTTGTVEDGPVSADGYTWWQVNFSDGVSGWSVEDYLVEASSTNATPTTPNVPTSAYPPGCDSRTVFSTTTGQPCSGGTVTQNPPTIASGAVYPPGCDARTVFSTTTGSPCGTATPQPPTTTGTLGPIPPPGCDTRTTFSTTTGIPCNTTTSDSPVSSVSFNPSTLTVSEGQSFMLNYTITGSFTSCAVSGLGLNSYNPTHSTGQNTLIGIAGTVSGSPYTYNVDCGNNGAGILRATATMTVVPGTQPTVSFSSVPQSVLVGSQMTLSWMVGNNATSCTAGGTGPNWSGGGKAFTNGLNSQTISGPSNAGSYTYTIYCTDALGQVSNTASATVSVTTPGPSVTLTVSPTTIVIGQPVTYTWSSKNATQCGIPPGTPGVLGIVTAGSYVSYPTVPVVNYTMTCYNASGVSGVSNGVNVNVVGPTVALTAFPTTVKPGQPVILTWSSAQTTQCSNPLGALDHTSGSVTVYPTQTTTYNVTCFIPAVTGSSQSVTVNVTSTGSSRSTQLVTPPPANPSLLPSVTLTANGDTNSTTVSSGQKLGLSWSATNATSCQLNGGSWSNAPAGLSGSAILSPNQSDTYTITCSNAQGSTSSSVIVSVIGGLSSLDKLSQTANALSATEGDKGSSGTFPPIPASTDNNSGFGPVSATTCLELQTTLKNGSSGTDVVALQNFLHKIGSFSVSSTGHFGSITQASVSAFQQKSGLTADGVVGPQTQAKIQAITCGRI